MRNAELDHGLHGLTRISGLSHPWPSVASVVTFCGMQNAEGLLAGGVRRLTANLR